MTDESHVLRAAYHTLGCKLNFAETSAIGKILAEKGIIRAAADQTPDIVVINTCSVTEMADKKGRQLIRKIAGKYPDATIVVTGCYAQLKPDEIATIPGVDIVLGSNEKLRIAQYLETWLQTRQKHVETTPPLEITRFQPSCERGDRTRYFLKVQDGCDYFCTYCTIPYARGRSRSGSISQLIDQARQVAEEGGKEIVITGVNIGEFGRDTGEKFFDLLRALDAVEEIERYRISSIEPNLLTEEIIRWCAHDSRAFMPHFHVPLQSGSDAVLKQMNRRYDTALFARRMEQIVTEIPDAFIGIDIIAGARGETPEEWQRSKDFLQTLPFAHLHVFPYSERPGTKALNIGHIVSQEEKHRRVAELTRLSDERQQAYTHRFIGSRRPVLWEHCDSSQTMHGLTDNYIRVTAPAVAGYENRVTDALLTGRDSDDPNALTAEPI